MKNKKQVMKRRRRILDEDRRSQQIVVRLKQKEFDELSSAADRLQMPMAFVVRQAIQLLIETKSENGNNESADRRRD